MSSEVEDPTEQDETEQAAAALTAAGDTEGALKLQLARATKALAKERGLRKESELASYKGELVTQFPYADPDLISGKSRAEMLASAERVHNAVVKVIEKQGLKAAPKVELTAAQQEEARLVKERENWGASPQVATEAVTGEAPMDLADLQRAGLTGKGPDGQPMDRRAVLAEMRANPRQIVRPTIAGTLRGRPAAQQ